MFFPSIINTPINKARRGNVTAALQLLLKHQQYRLDSSIEWWPYANVPIEHIRPAIIKGTIWIHGSDKVRFNN